MKEEYTQPHPLTLDPSDLDDKRWLRYIEAEERALNWRPWPDAKAKTDDQKRRSVYRQRREMNDKLTVILNSLEFPNRD